jgi:hypothetical protein
MQRAGLVRPADAVELALLDPELRRDLGMRTLELRSDSGWMG